MKKSLFFTLSFLIMSFTFLTAQDFSVKMSGTETKSPSHPEATVTLNWDNGTNFNSIGLSAGGTFEVAARFPASVTSPYVGYNLEKMEIYINDLPSACILKIYDQGTLTSPGTLLHSQNVTSSIVATSWNILTLSTPVAITGNDIWVGYEVTHAAGQFPCGVDPGPAAPDGDWIYLAPGPWQKLSVIAPSLNYNWNIHALLEQGTANFFFEDFETFIAGQQVACQDPVNWTTWSNLPCSAEDATISTNYAHSGTKSFVIVPTNDFVKPLGDKTTGQWYMSFWMYIPTGKAGYFNTLNTFPASTSGHWGMEVYFGDQGAGQGRLLAFNPATVNFTFQHNTWFMVTVMVNLDTDQAQFWLGSSMIHQWQWTRGNPGTYALRLAANDFYGPLQTAVDECYYDDYWYADFPIPVELTSFTANVNNLGQVVINWETATELNNQGFEIERRTETSEFRTIGFVEGHGTTTQRNTYSFVDKFAENGINYYRLKQIDFNGQYAYSDIVEVDVNGPLTFDLEQNYPNPFNPSTNIKYSVPEAGNIRLSVYNLVGEEVAVLVNGFSQAGFFEVTFDASNLSTGVYLYKLQSANSVQTKKMMLLK